MSARARAAVIAGLCAAMPALAQQPTANVSPPAEKFAVSPGGVDMRTGRYAYNQTDLVIGGEEGLSLARTLAQPVVGHNNPFANFSHSWDVLLTEKRINLQQNLFTHTLGQPDYQIEVVFGGRSQTFRAEGPILGFEQISRSGYAQLTHTGARSSASAVYTYRASDGTLAMFRQIGSADCSSVLRCAYVSEVTEPDGTRLTFDYDAPGGANTARLRSVTSSRGYALLIEYSGQLVAKACVLNLALAPKPSTNICPSGAQTANYAYASFGGGSRLSSAADPSGAVWGFTYGVGTIGIVRPGESTPWLTNGFHMEQDSDGLLHEVIDSQNFADGSSYQYGYDYTPSVPLLVSSIAGGSFTDSLGNVTQLRYDFPTRPYDPSQGHGGVPGDDAQTHIAHQVTPGPVEVTDPLGRVTVTDYCDPYVMANAPPNWLARCQVMPMPVSTTDPEGIRTEMAWDMALRNLLQTRQIARPGSGLPDIVRAATHDCTPANFRFCAKPVTVTDARGAVTDYSYAPEHGGLLTETGPAVAVIGPDDVPVAVRPQTRHKYAQRHAWISNGSGGYVQAATPVWLRIATSLCRTSAATGSPNAPCATAGDEVLTQYDYSPDAGPNTLLLRGQTVTATDGGVTTTLRTCSSYDALGRRISETQPNADLASCP